MIDSTLAYAIAAQVAAGQKDPKLAQNALTAIGIMLKQAAPDDAAMHRVLDSNEYAVEELTRPEA